MLDPTKACELVHQRWANELVEQISAYIAIPALSPAFDPDWCQTGHIHDAARHIMSWIEQRQIEGLSVRLQQLDGLTPLIVAEVEPFGPQSEHDAPVVLYGHLDKQPEMLPWDDGLAPWVPVKRGDRLYGRGGADDGYAAYAALTAIEAVQSSGGSHRRLFVLIEASEESGSPDLEAHMEVLGPEMGQIDLVVALDSSVADYERLWLTSSLRGLVAGVLRVEMLTEGIHSGSSSGAVPSTMRIMRQLLDRVEEASSGRVLVESATVEIPSHRRNELAAMVEVTGFDPCDAFPFVDGAGPTTDDPLEATLAQTWAPALSYVAIDGIPAIADGGNVLRPETAMKVSLRVPPTCDAEAVLQELTAIVLKDPPYGASVSFDRGEAADGWNAPALPDWLSAALDEASGHCFGETFQVTGEGGTIPFMGMLGASFPAANFVITGVLGPGSNAHGPNEYLALSYAEKVTAAVAMVLDRHAQV